MKIIRYKKFGKNKYKVYLENEDYIILYEDIILKYNLLLTKEIDDLSLIEEENNKYGLYDKVLNYISKRLKSESEIRSYLKKYTKDLDEIDKIIKKLYDNKYIDNNLYIKSFIHDKINFTNDGPNKIKKQLESMNLDTYLIDDLLSEFNYDLQMDKINNYINKNLKRNNKSLYVFKQKMLINLINLGYFKEDIMTVLDKIEIDDSSLKDKEREKLILKYSKKYKGHELENIVNRKLYERGYR